MASSALLSCPFPSRVILAGSVPSMSRIDAVDHAEALLCFPGSPSRAMHILSPAAQPSVGCGLTLRGTAALPRCLQEGMPGREAARNSNPS